MKITAGTLADRLMHATISLARFAGGASILLGVLSYLTNTLFHDELLKRGMEWLDLIWVVPCFVLAGLLYIGAAQYMLGRHVGAVIVMLLLSAAHAVPTSLYVMIFLGEFWPLALFFMALLAGVLMTVAFSARLLVATISQHRREARNAVITVPQSMLRAIRPPPKSNPTRPLPDEEPADEEPAEAADDAGIPSSN